MSSPDPNETAALEPTSNADPNETADLDPTATATWQPGSGTSRGLLDAVLEYQGQRWRQGQGVPVEQILSEHPTLASSVEAMLELIVHEAVLRDEAGTPTALADFQQRFPALAEELRIQWEVDRLLFSRLSQGRDATTRSRSPAGAARIGRYEIRGVLGKGGMGVAYKAWDPDLRRIVALKTLRADDADDGELARFRAEAEAIARIRHPGIVEVYDIGEQDGQPYFTMEFCTGGTLADRLKDRPLSPREAAAMVVKIVEGVAAAHAGQVIHRDLKPANVLLQAASGRQAGEGFVPKVTDFGLARKLDEDGQTRTGAIMGTPSYMAPEQALGDTKNLGPAVDVYALGAILYECLTGRPPFRGATVMETLGQVRHGEPVPVRQLQPSVPRDLETIAQKCLRKEPARRYASAQALADDLQRYLEGRPIRARRTGALEQGWRWCRRNPVVASLLVAIFVTLSGGLLGMTLLYRQAEANFQQAEENADQAFKAVDRGFTRISQEKLLLQPGMAQLRRDLLSESRPYLEWFVAKNGMDNSHKSRSYK